MSVATEDVLDWMRQVLGVHHDHPDRRGDTAVVMATALPERDRWIPLIREMLEAEEGVLVDATKYGRGAACGNLEEDAPLLLNAIDELLTSFNREETHADLKLEIVGGSAQVVGAQDYESINAAQRAFREVVAALCSDDLRSSDLVAVVYAEDSLDESRAKEVWDIMMRLPSLLDLSASATIAVVACDGTIDFDIHCDGFPSLRARILDGGGLQTRHSWSRSIQPILDLRQYSREQQPLLVLFLGAGASVADGLPTGDSLRNQSLSRLLGKPVDRGTFDHAAREWWRNLASTDDLSDGEVAAGVDDFVRTLTLERVIAHEQRQQNQNFSTTLRDFARRHTDVIAGITASQRAGGLADDPLTRLVACQQRLVLVTVNFDRVIEARAGEAQLKRFVSEEDLSEFGEYLPRYKADGGAIPLLKLHGDIELPDTIVANIDETQAGLSGARDAALLRLMEELEPQPVRSWWYVGYSMRDRDLSTTWRSPRFTGYNEYWVSPFLDPSVGSFIEQHRMLTWERAGRRYTPMKRLITLTAKNFFDLLAAEVTSKWS